MELILTHSYTDFDALASQLAAARLYPRALPLLNAQLNENVREFAALHARELPFVRAADLPDEPVERVILVDTANAPRLPQLGDAPVPTLIVDHHPLERPLRPHEQLLHADTGANTTILAQQIMERGLPLTQVEATLLLLGIYEDTGGLSLPGTRQADVACAAWLIGEGARLEALAEFLRRPLSAAQEALLQQMVGTMRLVEIDGWSALFAWARAEGTVPELSPLAHRLRDLYQPALAALAVEMSDAGCQLILRSNGEAVDAGALAAVFGGGGHSAAAAAFVRGRTAPDLLADVEAAARRIARPAVTAADIMTSRVHSAPLGATVGQAEELLARYGHSALPVVDDAGVVQGLILRRDLDRALRHGLRDAPLARYLWHGPTVLAPDAPLAAVRQALAADNGERTGRVLVADEGRRLVGIITRADLLRYWSGTRHAEAEGHETLAEELERFLPPATVALLRQAAARAEERGWALYVVGGTVRDMLLGRPQEDLDIVVEGDAIGLARALARELGGHVRSHAAFGTATLELPSAEGRVLHAGSPGPQHAALSLDFVTARTEFYERPAALPDVEAASLRHDLHRRDFTINTLAVCLNPSRYGRLYDFYGGRSDIRRGLVRVLHNLSFIDDPTRILRAARLAARLGFTIEPRTRALIADALEHAVLERTTPQRIANELRLTLLEEAPERALALLDELGVLRALHPALRWSPALAAQFARAREARFPRVELADLYLALMVYPLGAGEREALIARYRPPAPQARLLRELSELQERVAPLRAGGVPDSAVDRALHGLGETALRAAQLAEPPPAAEAIVRYLEQLRGVKLAVDGRFLKELGLRPGPRFGELLAELRAAVLDGAVHTPEEQRAWLRRRVAGGAPP
ncbi:MAG TPA: CBS domain-containing protein [Roseiflexaceae bacterium]|nr:CBS domain-containing protein [Roseiflexaceae bacterium]